MKRVFQDITNVFRKNIKLTVHKTSRRTKLLRWLYEVVCEFKYTTHTYALAVHIIDRYTQPCDYQLLGISSLFVSAKIEETVLQPLKEYSNVTCNSYTKEDILNMERNILLHFDFTFRFILPLSYLKLDHLENGVINQKRSLFLLSAIICWMMEKEEAATYWVYEESRRVALEIVRGRGVEESLKFYIEKGGLKLEDLFK
jgi:hypothetical protein